MLCYFAHKANVLLFDTFVTRLIIYVLHIMLYIMLGFVMCVCLIKLYYSIFTELCTVSRVDAISRSHSNKVAKHRRTCSV